MISEMPRDIWKLHEDGLYVVIPTNGTVKSNGEAVMGRGLAFQASLRFQNLPQVLGTKLLQSGNNVYIMPEYRLITFPVKHQWHQMADPVLIEQSLVQLVGKVRLINKYPVALPRVGCGNGGLKWDDVRPLLEKHLDVNFVVAYSAEHDGKAPRPSIQPIA